MNTIRIKTSLFASILLLAATINAQVTIGSQERPNNGSLLDLKHDNTSGQNAKGGLGMPRVNLSSLTIPDNKTLAQTIIGTEATDNWDKDQHIGLVVYNLTDKDNICPGLYVWDGSLWQKLGESCPIPPSISVSPAGPFYFMSGQNGSTITAQNVNVEWTPITAEGGWKNVANGTFGKVNFSASAISPALPWTTTPQTVTLTPDVMPLAEVSANPFLTKESVLSLTATLNGKTGSRDVVVNQTNKAITLTTIFHNAPANGTVVNDNTIKSNSKWKLESIFPNDGTAAISDIKLGGVTLSVNQIFDWEMNDGNNNSGVLSYTILTGASKAQYTKLTFSDAESTKRFNDITLNVYQCSNKGVNPRISEWAAIAGFKGVSETWISDADDIAKGINIPDATTGIAWHRDQDGNVFLSSSFHPTDITGDSERWMITNLAATKYASNVTHAANRKLSGPNYNQGDPVPFNTAYWGYPGTDISNYNNDPRVGLLYTWDAATAGKGGESGVDGVLQEGGINHAKTQGVCPTGWHLPSDYDWTVLENIMVYRTATFSSMPDIYPNNPNAFPQIERSTVTHGKAMKEACQAFTNNNQGASNPISTYNRPGFGIMIAGHANNGLPVSFKLYGFYWSSSYSSTNGTWIRIVSYDTNTMAQAYSERNLMCSVRCKKD